MCDQCQDEFLHCTDPGSDQERINITFRWVKQHVASSSFLRTGVACCLPTCARVFLFLGVGGDRWFLGFLASPCCLVHLGGASFACHPPLCVQGLGFKDVPPAGHALRAEVGGSIIFVTSGGFAGQHKKLQIRFVGFHEIKLFVLALVGRPSLHSYESCMVYWVQALSHSLCVVSVLMIVSAPRFV